MTPDNPNKAVGNDTEKERKPQVCAIKPVTTVSNRAYFCFRIPGVPWEPVRKLPQDYPAYRARELGYLYTNPIRHV